MTDPDFTTAPEGAAASKGQHLADKCAQVWRGKTAFLYDETGAVTVDWMVLSIAIVAMVAALFASFGPQILAALAGLF